MWIYYKNIFVIKSITSFLYGFGAKRICTKI